MVNDKSEKQNPPGEVAQSETRLNRDVVEWPKELRLRSLLPKVVQPVMSLIDRINKDIKIMIVCVSV